MRYVSLAIFTAGVILGLGSFGQTSANAGPKGNIAAGKELYHQSCSACHGVDGKGIPPSIGGAYDPQSIEPSRRVRPADLTKLSEENQGKFPADRVRNAIYNKDKIPSHGTPEMPAWGDVFYLLKSQPKVLEKRIRDLTAYIESIQTTKKQ
jgi:mono/diheme cytochrome c family protein